MPSLDTRSEERDSLFLRADLSVEGAGPSGQGTVRNLSAGGMMVESQLRPKRGTRLTVHLRNIGPVTGTVVWMREHRFGAAFDEEIDPKMARSQIVFEDKEAPVYARAAVSAPRHDGWNGKLRRI